MLDTQPSSICDHAACVQ